MKTHLPSPSIFLAALLAFGTWAVPVQAQNHCKSFSISTCDNNTFIVQNYLPTRAEVTVSVAGNATEIRELPTGEKIAPVSETGRGYGRGGGFGGRSPLAPPPRTSFTFTVLPHSYRAFAAK
ncbi:MAG TPA: hypothetical protein VNT26_18015 [Candidatus Sulfotelmatobacter sp.]|nr:hypothetical protein [Candidatus Sulfotelmatobacter sp.]